MAAEMQEMIHFHLTGKRGEAGSGDALQPGICPALLAPYQQLSKLRYDYPLILLDDDKTEAFLDTLSNVINRLLRDIAPEGDVGARLRQHVLRLETRMRELLVDGSVGTLASLWGQAQKSLLAECEKSDSEALKNSLDTARFALKIDGRVVDCDDRLPAQLLQHTWARVEARRTRKTLGQIKTLVIKLRNMLKVDDLKTGRARTPQRLKQTLGRRYQDAFDFELMSDLLDDSAPQNRMPADRRERVRSALSILESQKFFGLVDRDKHTQDGTQHSFLFNNISMALKAYSDRLPEIAQVIKAIAIAELECENAYRESDHAAYFERFGAQALAPADLALFPSYLICIRESECDSREKAELTEIASSDLRMKVLLQVGDVLGEPSPVDGQLHRGAFVQQLANAFVAPGNAYVLQSASSNLYRQKEELRKGLEFAGPAIFSILSGRGQPQTSLPPYLLAAAAMESRVFPAFSYDPAAGRGLADRFSINANPEIEQDWPRRELIYEDEDLQTITEDQAFTLVDFAVTDPRYGHYFAPVSRESWSDDMLPVADYLDLNDDENFEKVPYVPIIDANNVLRRLVVDDNLIRVAGHCRDRWRILQEQGGINNSYASALLSKEKIAWEEEKEAQIQSIRAELAQSVQTQPSEVVTAPAVEESAGEPDIRAEVDVTAEVAAPVVSDDAYIETPLCTTCDECTNRNDRMFAYDENKQAYIKDIDAGSFKDLVESAEVCQVAIIHPGKPRNQNEPGLDELIKRAEPFLA